MFIIYHKLGKKSTSHLEQFRAIQFSSFSLHFREDRDSEIAPTEERLEHQMRIIGQLNGSEKTLIFG